MGVVAPATIAMWFPLARQGMPMGIWATWVPVGNLIMFILAPVLVVSIGWQAIWWVGAIYALVMLFIYGSLVCQRPALQEDLPLSAELFQLDKTLANRDIWLLSLAFACFTLVMMSIGTYYPTYLNMTLGYTLGQAALISSIATIMLLISAPMAGWISDRIGSRRLIFSLPFLVIGLLCLFPLRVTGWQIVAFVIVQGLVGGVIPTATLVAAPEVMRKPELAGMGLAVVLVGQNLGQLLGPIVFGQLVDQIGWVYAGYMLNPVCLLGFVSGWFVRIR